MHSGQRQIVDSFCASQLILHIGAEVHLTSFESKLDLPISTLYQVVDLARDEVRGDFQTIINLLQKIEHSTHQNERAPTREVSDGVITTQVKLVEMSLGWCFTDYCTIGYKYSSDVQSRREENALLTL